MMPPSFVKMVLLIILSTFHLLFSHILSNILDPTWSKVYYCVFDSTTQGPITERHAFLTRAIAKCKSKNIKAVTLTLCESKAHLMKSLEEVANKKGEGLMLYHPTESYQSGRTEYLLKVKVELLNQ